jgi:plasmid stabilization system protein ParE
MPVILSAQASKQLEELLDYLETEWSAASRRIFQKKLDVFIEAIKQMPYAFPASRLYHNCRKCVITPQTSLYYRVKGDIIEIIAVLDNRRNL